MSTTIICPEVRHELYGVVWWKGDILSVSFFLKEGARGFGLVSPSPSKLGHCELAVLWCLFAEGKGREGKLRFENKTNAL